MRYALGMNVVMPLVELKRLLSGSLSSTDEQDAPRDVVPAPARRPRPAYDGARLIADLDHIRVQKAMDNWSQAH